jgi:hypothetical protein
MKLAFFLFFSLLILVACGQLEYRADLNFLNSAQANSPEYLAFINGKPCKDMDGQIGLCAKRIRSDEKITMALDKRPYAYRLNVVCSSNVDFKLSVDVVEDKPFSFDILPASFGGLKSFTCTGEVFPQDRPQEVSAFWHARFVIYDKNYQAREEIYSARDTIIFGQHAKYTLVNDEIVLKKKTTYNFKKVKRAFSESELMRFNYYGY